MGGSSPVNAAITAGHTCGWSVGQGNAAVAMTMIRLRSGGWNHPAGTTGGPLRPLSVDQVLSRNSPHGLPVDSKLLTSPTHKLAWAVDNRVSDSSNVVWFPWWFRSFRVWLSVSVFTIEVMHSPMGSELVDPSVDHWVDRKFTTSEPFYELQLSCVDRLLPKICLNYKYLLLSSPGSSKVKFGRLFRTLILLGKSEK